MWDGDRARFSLSLQLRLGAVGIVATNDARVKVGTVESDPASSESSKAAESCDHTSL